MVSLYVTDLRKNIILKDVVRTYDIAPTILHIFGLPIPSVMEGRVLKEIFEPCSELAQEEPKYVDPSYYARLRLARSIRKLRETLTKTKKHS